MSKNSNITNLSQKRKKSKNTKYDIELKDDDDLTEFKIDVLYNKLNKIEEMLTLIDDKIKKIEENNVCGEECKKLTIFDEKIKEKYKKVFYEDDNKTKCNII